MMRAQSPAAAQAHPPYRPDIDGLRAVAVAVVVLFHAFPSFFPAGFVGVDVFFVISGYLITQIILRAQTDARFTFSNFYARRIRRILPALVLVLAATYAAGWFTQFSQDFKALGKHIAGAAGFVSNLVLLGEAGYFDTASELKPLLHLWSLAIEEQFYILWPAILVLSKRYRIPFLPLTGLLAAASFIGCLVLTQHDATIAFFFSPTRFWEILAGALLAGYEIERGPLPSSNLRSVTGLALLIAGFILIGKGRAFPGFWALLPVMGTAMLLAAGPHGSANRLLATPALVALGLISYPLYLWHWPILVFLRQIGGSGLPSWALVAGVGAAVVLATLTYRLVERPIRFGSRGRLVVMVLLAVLVGLGYLGFNAFQREGLRFRAANKGNGLEFDWREAWRHKRCFLEARDAASATFDPVCSGREGQQDKRPLVVLWGDSHAAALYPGFAAQQAARGFALAQFNASACPPVFDLAVGDRPECLAVNARVKAFLAQNKPHTLVMAGFWTLYFGADSRWSGLSEARIEQTLLSLRAMGIERIVLVGPLPGYKRELPKFAAQLFHPGEAIRTRQELDEAVLPIEARMRQLAARNALDYASAYDTLCNEAGCLISFSNEHFEPVQWDGNHLTTGGARLVVDGLLRRAPALLPER